MKRPSNIITRYRQIWSIVLKEVDSVKVFLETKAICKHNESRKKEGTNHIIYENKIGTFAVEGGRSNNAINAIFRIE